MFLSTLVDRIVSSHVLTAHKAAIKKRNDTDRYVTASEGRNILALGYSYGQETFNSSTVLTNSNMMPGITNTHANSSVTLLKTGVWKRLHDIVGDEVMMDLIGKCTLMIKCGGKETESAPNTQSGRVTPTVDGVKEMEIGKKKKKKGRGKKNRKVLDSANSKPVAAGTDCYYQLCGLPLHSLVYDANTSQSLGERGMAMTCQRDEGKGSKEVVKNKNKNKNKNQNKEKNKIKTKPVIIPRFRIYYSSSYVRKAGFPKTHIYNKLVASSSSKEDRAKVLASSIVNSIASGSLEGIATTRKLVKYPHSLVSVCCDMLRAHEKCDYHRLLTKTCPLDKRLVRQPSSSSSSLKSPYKCSPVDHNPTTRSPKSTNFIYLLSGDTVSSAGDTSAPAALPSPAFKPLPPPPPLHEQPTSLTLPDVVQLYSPHSQVQDFLNRVFSLLLPPALLGSQANMNVMLANITTFVSLRMRETVSIGNLMAGIRVTDIPWLYPPPTPTSSSSASSKPTASHHLKATHLLATLLHFIYTSLITPIIRSQFYATETEFGGNRTYYYRKPVWKRLRTLSMDSFKTGNQYEAIGGEEAVSLLGGQVMGCAQLRLLPKVTGVRAIAMLSRRRFVEDGKQQGNGGSAVPVAASNNGAATAAGGLKRQASLPPLTNTTTKLFKANTQESRMTSTNVILKPSFQILKFEHGEKPEVFGVGVYGFDEFFGRMVGFVERVKRRSVVTAAAAVSAVTGLNNAKTPPPLPKLYFASADIHHCFDKINQPHLFALLTSLLQEDDYLIQKYSVCHPFDGGKKVQTRHMKKVLPVDKMELFGKVAEELAERYNQSVFVDGVVCSVLHKERVLALLKEHIFSHIVVASNSDVGKGRSFFRQKEGIAQGSVLSTLLCNVYYGDVEKDLLKGVFDGFKEEEGDDYMLVRIVDDFLLVTTKEEAAVEFLTKMKTGDPKLGVKINDAKTVVNFNVPQGIGGRKCDDLQTFSWCGLVFDTTNCEVRVDYDRFNGSKATDALTVETTRNPGTGLLVKMKSFVRPRVQPLCLDGRLNSKTKVLTNIHQAFILAAVKTYSYLKNMGSSGLTSNVPFVLKAIEDLASYSHCLIHKRVGSCGGVCRVSRCGVQGLCFGAFRLVFGRKEEKGDGCGVVKGLRLMMEVEEGVDFKEIARIEKLSLETLRIGEFEY